ncbi:MAG TPA: BMP family ABC transporter substrate-binding protein [Actinomycetales bacterium]|nr:BMP family ABC transporter substrate-binding protein [Actinomycetales bacterium]
MMKWAAVVSTAALALSACGGSDSPGAGGGATTGGSSSGGAKPLKVGMAYDIGGRGDQSFNDSAAAGLDKAKTDFGGDTQEAEAANGEAESAKEDRLRTLAQAGYSPIVAVGFAYATSLGKVAKEFPEVKFAIVDSADVKAANISNLTFAENEGSFLVGAAAALKSKKANIGFVGGVQTPLIAKFEAGYMAGAKAVNPKITVQSKYLTQPPDFSGFNDPAKGKTAAQGMIDAGADVIYHAAGGSGSGVFEAAKAGNTLAIGVDSDQAKTAAAGVRDVILTSMLKKVDVAVYDFIKSVQDGSVKSGEQVYDLKAGGIDYATTGGKVDDIKAKLDAYKQQIIDGKITVPSKP